MKVVLSAMGAQVRVSELQLDGQVSFVFAPLTPKPPYFGGLEIFFVNHPALNFQVSGNVIPKGLQLALRAAVAEALATQLVLPYRIATDLDVDEGPDAADLRTPDPISVLRLTVLRATDLAAADYGG
eukprot:CAMPEP_0183589438 /NCGR_PEP_ID=MMETSP0371-20130417/162692_1 /TAXON_ID=268820 /ORGANISM="Peridinium aciculiferum, Strain PAER-2" /LENGTH=126 /DNA_ID=CAMNT_0025800755 /DNA_START=84 /DNA_END=461 /DNA_ORIENTATION=+